LEPGVGASKRGPLFAIAIAAVLGITVAGVWWAGFGVQNDTLETIGELEPLVPDAVEASRNSIAVLPFENLSNLSENAFFAAGMQEDILNSLAHIPELLVTSRTTTLRYIDSGLSLPEIAAELNVAYIIEGSVRRVGDEVRISVQLIEAANDKHVWSQGFDRTIQDVFAIQAEVAERVAEELQLKIVNERRGQKPTDNVVAYDLFLRGRELASEFSTSSLERALNLYESAIEVDPGFADAYAGKAAALALVGHYYPSQWQVQRDPAFAAAEKALELDPESAEANLGMGSILTAPTEARYGEAVPYLRRAVAKNPNDTLSRFYLAVAYSFLELKDEMSVQEHEIYRRDPFSTRSNLAMALALGLESKPDETRIHVSRALQPDDLAPYWHWLAGRASWWAGDYHAAAHHLHGALEVDPAYAWARFELVLVFTLLGDTEAADRWLRKSEAEPSAFVGVENRRLWWYRSEKRVDDYVALADAWLERSPANPSARLAVAWALALRAEESYRRGDSETWRTLAEESLEAQLAGLRGTDGDISIALWNVNPVMNAAATAARLGEKSLAEDLYRKILQRYGSRETPLNWRHLEVAMAKAALGRSQEAIEHLEEYFEAGRGSVLAMEAVFNDPHGIFHELPAMAADRGIRNKMVERNTATIRRIREDYPALFNG
jgi:TolB-like protein